MDYGIGANVEERLFTISRDSRLESKTALVSFEASLFYYGSSFCQKIEEVKIRHFI